MFTEVAPGVFAVDHSVVEGKNGVVFGNRRVLVIDTGNYADDGRKTAEFTTQQSPHPRYVAYTHGHGDHTLGSAGLSAVETYAHALTSTTMRAGMPSTIQPRDMAGDAAAKHLCWPTITFEGALTIDLGGKTARLFATPGHSVDSICIYLVEDRVLFTGDTVVTCIVPAVGDGNSLVMEKSLRSLTELDVEVLVPGHGPVVYGVTAARESIAWCAAYLASVRAAIRELLPQTADASAIADRIDYERFVGDRLPRDRHGMAKRHKKTVLALIREEMNQPDSVD